MYIFRPSLFLSLLTAYVNIYYYAFKGGKKEQDS